MTLGDLVKFQATNYHLLEEPSSKNGGQNFYLVQRGEVGILIEILTLDRCRVLQGNKILLTTTHYLSQE